MESIIIAIIGGLFSIASYFFGRRKTSADSETTEIGNVNLWIEAHNKIIEDLKVRIFEGIQSNQEMRKYYNERINYYEQQQQDLKKTIKELSLSNKKLHKDITDFKREFPCVDCPRKQTQS